eukprot:4000-Heterococcus_DN1.PRE.1
MVKAHLQLIYTHVSSPRVLLAGQALPCCSACCANVQRILYSLILYAFISSNDYTTVSTFIASTL